MTMAYRDLIGELSDSANPIIRYKTRVRIEGLDSASKEARGLREEIREAPVAKGLLADLEQSDPKSRGGNSTIYLTTTWLADIDYPPGDAALNPYRDHVYAWLRRLEKEYDGPLCIRDKHRVHGSFHGNAIYASIVLGIANGETDDLCANLLRYQWPGGGWNCNKKPATRGPTIVHTAFGLRGLVTYLGVHDAQEIRQAADDAAEVLLERQVYLSRRSGKPLRPEYAKNTYPYPRLYNFMAGLHVLARSGHITDPRCAHALDLLESKFIEGEGWEMERKLLHHNPKRQDLYTNAFWEREKNGKANLFLTVDALEILAQAGRIA